MVPLLQCTWQAQRCEHITVAALGNANIVGSLPGAQLFTQLELEHSRSYVGLLNCDQAVQPHQANDERSHTCVSQESNRRCWNIARLERTHNTEHVADPSTRMQGVVAQVKALHHVLHTSYAYDTRGPATGKHTTQPAHACARKGRTSGLKGCMSAFCERLQHHA